MYDLLLPVLLAIVLVAVYFVFHLRNALYEEQVRREKAEKLRQEERTGRTKAEKALRFVLSWQKLKSSGN